MRKQRILVVEDYGPLLVGIQGILELEGYTVFTATDGVQALQVMEERVVPDLIISDVAMPGMDGHAFLKTVHARPEWMSIPFIFLTARTGKEDIFKAKNLGARDYITKPFIPQRLMAVVHHWLEHARVTQEAT
jgi:CheY-like chemotaxis protein